MDKPQRKTVEFTQDMKKDYTILVPNMAPIHFSMLENILVNDGYKVKLLNNSGQQIIDMGLKYVHNDTCYPALLTIGQFMDELINGDHDLDKVALIMSQTGGGCRASNYIHLIRKALKNAGIGHIPVISFSIGGLEKHSGFKVTLSFIRRALSAIVYGDMIMLLSNQTRPYEMVKGETDKLIEQWVSDISGQFTMGHGISSKEIEANLKQIAKDFASIPVKRTEKVKVGIVGEIYVKYSPFANNYLEEMLHKQNCEVMVPGLLQFFIYMADHRIEDHTLYGGHWLGAKAAKYVLGYFKKFESMLIDILKEYPEFTAPSDFYHLKSLGTKIIGSGCKMGEGWLLTAEMVELLENGYSNIVCVQPFGCLPNHISGKGTIREIKKRYPTANIVPIDYDPSATKVNQENRIKLMLATAKDSEINVPKIKVKSKAPSLV